MANDPDPPPAPLINTRLPALAERVPCHAIAPACGIVDASTKVSPAGFSANADSGAIAYSAKPPFKERLSP